MNENKQCQGQNQEINPDDRQTMEEKNEKELGFKVFVKQQRKQ